MLGKEREVRFSHDINIHRYSENYVEQLKLENIRLRKEIQQLTNRNDRPDNI